MSETVLRVEGLRLRRGQRLLLDGTSFGVARGELVAIMGPSGSGKTTVLRTIAGLESFDHGTVTVDDIALEGGATPSSNTLRGLRRRVGMVFQFHCLFEHLSTIQNVCLAPQHAHRIPRDVAWARARELLSAFGVDHRADALPRQLSGGEAQRVAIARALAMDPAVLLMDEPTASLDSSRRAELGRLLLGLLNEDRTLLIATHDEEFAQTWATRVLRMRDGVVG